MIEIEAKINLKVLPCKAICGNLRFGLNGFLKEKKLFGRLLLRYITPQVHLLMKIQETKNLLA